MKDDFDRARQLYDWDKYVLSILGVWPLDGNYIKFSFWVIYVTIHLSTEFADLYYSRGDLELVILNVSESTWEIMIMVKLIVIRFSKTLEELFVRVLNGVKSGCYNGSEEREIYLGYNRIAKTFFKASLICCLSSSVLLHLKPLEFRLRAVFSNESMPFVLPYRTRLFFNVNDSSTFWLVWIYQSPMVYIHPWHGLSIGIIFSLVAHVCGELSVLAFRIKNLDVDLNTDLRHEREIFRDLVERQLTIVWMVEAINYTFRFVLLEELLVMTVILGLTAYSVLANLAMSNVRVLVTFLMFDSAMLILFYGYCIAGQFLLTESTRVNEAYYQCRWYDLSSSSKKKLIICMAASREPLKLTGGGYYTLSLESYANILKTALSYISLLRTVV